MAKSIVLGILMETLGEYVDISREKLKMAVWSGEIELRNLSLKSTAFASLDLPVRVLHGTLGSLKITIPWTNLGKSSTLVQLDGLIAHIGPSDDRSFTAEDLQRHSSELKRKILEKAERIAYAYISDELNKKEIDRTHDSKKDLKKSKRSWMTSVGVSYVQGMVAKILANIELKFKNIHIRYEDSVAIPGTLISAGLTIDELLIITTDENWVEKTTSGFKKISGMIQGNSGIMFKIATLCNLTLYWDTDSKSIGDMAQDDSNTKWSDTMKALIYSDKNKVEVKSHYIMLPPNLITLKLAHNNEKIGQILEDDHEGGGSAVSSSSPQNRMGLKNDKNDKKVSRGSVGEDDLPCLADVAVDIGRI
jgi:vacuolar protein sorting-associated protein 13A/C